MKNRGRDSIFSILLNIIIGTRLSQIILLQVPAFFLLGLMMILMASSCNGPEGSEGTRLTTYINIGYETPGTKAASWRMISGMDLFVFDEDGIRALDCYLHLGGTDRGKPISILSGSGGKIVSVIANGNLEEEEIMAVGRYDDLRELYATMEDEDPDHPTLYGELNFVAGKTVTTSLVLRALTAQVDITSIDVGDLEDVEAYIVNAAGRCAIIPGESFNPDSYLNQGCLREKDLARMKNPELLCSGISSRYGATLYCFPNTVEEETTGSPYTRLQIEGTASDGRRIYPIEIGRPGKGVERGHRYAYTISIGKGGENSLTLHPGDFLTCMTGDVVHVWCDSSPASAEVKVCEDDLEYDRERGIYDYKTDDDGRGVTLTAKNSGTGMFVFDAGPPINGQALVIVVVNP